MPILNSKLKYLFLPLGYLYDTGSGIRNLLFDLGWKPVVRLSKPVISIGNLSFGGTGKTPLVAKLANYLRDSGLRVCILSRGYGRKTRSRVLVSDFLKVYADPESAGDEPAMLARDCPGVMVVVDSDRVSAARAFETDCDCFILDDGFQHRSLHRDLDIVLLDARHKLRRFAPASLSGYREGNPGLKRASTVVLTHAETGGRPGRLERYLRPSTPVFSSSHLIGKFRELNSGKLLTPSEMSGREVVAFSGIGNPAAFESALESLGLKVVAKKSFPDHHWYRREDLANIVNAYPGATLVTTEKDEVKLLSFLTSFPKAPIFSALLEIDVHEWSKLTRMVSEVIGASKR